MLECTGVEKCLEFAKNNIVPGGRFIATVQVNNTLQPVSHTGVESIKKAGLIFKTVHTEILLVKGNEMGYTLVDSEANQLPNGKTFLTFDFIYK